MGFYRKGSGDVNHALLVEQFITSLGGMPLGESSQPIPIMKNPLPYFRKFTLGAAFASAAWLSGSTGFAATVAYWRFDGSDLYADASGNNHALYSKGTTAPTSYTLPASGNGSTIPKTIPQNQLQNGVGVSLTGNKNFGQADSSAFINSTFTFELFFNSVDFGSNNKYLAGVTGSWTIFTSSTGELFLALSANGSSYETISSKITLVKNTDYYLAVSVDLSQTSASGITFYLQNFTAGGELEVSSATHTTSSLYASTNPFSLGSPSASPGGAYFAGIMDEVRYSDNVLQPGQLLAAIPEPTMSGLFGAVAVVAVVFRIASKRS